MRNDRRQSGFTLIELTVGLMVGAIIMAAIASLIDATSCAKAATDDMGRDQAELRQVTMRISETIRCSTAVIKATFSEVKLWQDIDLDGCKDDDEKITIGVNGLDRNLVIDGYQYDNISNVYFGYDNLINPRLVVVWFDYEMDGQVNTIRINSAVRCRGD